MLNSIFEIIVTGVTAAATAVGGAACDTGTFIADTAVYVADTVATTTVDCVDEVGCWITDVTEELFGDAPKSALEGTGVENIQVEDVQVEEIQVETILYEDVTTTWPD